MTLKAVMNSLKQRQASAVDLAKQFDRSIVAVEEDLRKIRKELLDNPQLEFTMTTAVCRECNFQYSDRDVVAPTRCPNCRREKITIPTFRIVDKGSPRESN